MCALYHLKFEDRCLDPIDDYDVFDSEEAALGAFDDLVAHPTFEFGSVYLVKIDGDSEFVIAGHYFTETSDQVFGNAPPGRR
jgi:hypothetical protein